MDFLISPFGVMIILGIVVVAAVTFQPAKYLGAWREVAERYETDRRPSNAAFKNENVSLGNREGTRVDAALDDEGFWMLYHGPEPKMAPDCVLIPWDCIRFKQENDHNHNFQIRLKKPLEFFVSKELGASLQRRSMTMP